MIRKLKKENVNAIYKFAVNDFDDDPWLTKKYLRDTIDAPGYHYGYFVNNELAGAILVNKFDRPKLWIFFLAVKEGFKRKGIATSLLKKVEERCDEEYPMIFVDIWDDSKAAKKFYIKNNFKRCAKIKDWYAIGEPGVIYSKRVI